MKNIFKSISLLLLVLNCLTLTAQTKREQLVGTWVFDYEVSIAKMDDKAKKYYDIMQEVSKSRFEKSFKDRKLSFNADGSFLQQTADGRSIIGTWVLSSDHQNIIMTNQQGSILDLKIKTLSASLLVLKPKNNGKGQKMLSEWDFIKN